VEQGWQELIPVHEAEGAGRHDWDTLSQYQLAGSA